jgi:hypothetical protein
MKLQRRALPPAVTRLFLVRRMSARQIPTSPMELLEALSAIYPEFQGEYDPAGYYGRSSFHSILTGFCCFFGAVSQSSSPKQLRALGQLISAAVTAPDASHPSSLGNAFGTCLLEHLHQIRARRALMPYLSKDAREHANA